MPFYSFIRLLYFLFAFSSSYLFRFEQKIRRCTICCDLELNRLLFRFVIYSKLTCKFNHNNTQTVLIFACLLFLYCTLLNIDHDIHNGRRDWSIMIDRFYYRFLLLVIYIHCFNYRIFICHAKYF